MSDKTQTVRFGPGFPALLTLLFIGLKLTGHIAWSWWWVLSPMWIGACLAVVILIGVALAALVAVALDR